MQKYGWSLEGTYQFVREKRQRIKQNFGFWGQLQSFELNLQHKSPRLPPNCFSDPAIEL
jgi:hypothetical protein